MKSRRERREEARKTNTEFKPQYKSGTRVNFLGEEYKVGGEPRTYEETYNVGYERFNTKYVTIKENIVDAINQSDESVTIDGEKISVEDNEDE